MISIQNQDESTTNHYNKHINHIFRRFIIFLHSQQLVLVEITTPRFKSQWFEEVCAVLREAALLEGGRLVGLVEIPGRTSEDISNKRETFLEVVKGES